MLDYTYTISIKWLKRVIPISYTLLFLSQLETDNTILEPEVLGNRNVNFN